MANITDKNIHSINGKGFQVAIHFDENGCPVIGNVLGFFDKTEDAYTIKPVSEEAVKAIAKALGIEKSSKTELVSAKDKRKANRINEIEGLKTSQIS